MTSPFPGPNRLDEDAVAGLLRETSTDYPDLPAAVADRLDSVLAELPELAAPDTGVPAAPARTPWWRRRVALTGALGTGLAAVVAVGLLVTAPWAPTSAPGSTADDTVAANGQNGDKNAETEPSSTEQTDLGPDEEGSATESDGYPITYSGRDYQDGELGAAASPAGAGINSTLDETLDPLLSDPARRGACLTAVLDRYTGVVTTVDFGSYRTTPAMLVVVDRSDADTTTVVAVGSACGSGVVDELAAESSG